VVFELVEILKELGENRNLYLSMHHTLRTEIEYMCVACVMNCIEFKCMGLMLMRVLVVLME